MLYVVCVIHALFWLALLPESLSSLLLFEMPAIFAISGYAFRLAKSREQCAAVTSTTRGYAAFVAARFSRILVPYFAYVLVCLVFILARLHFSGGDGGDPFRIVLSWLNPLSYGRDYSPGMLNWHLWFVGVFLLVSAALPLACRFMPARTPPYWVGVIVGTFAFYLASLIPGNDLLKQSLFYLGWALLGYHLADRKTRISLGECMKVAVTAGAGLLLVGYLNADPIAAMNMQANKFPPNHLFFLFSCLWMSFLLALCQYLARDMHAVRTVASRMWLRPFIASGYSVYLWQGLGYTVAVRLGEALGLSMLTVWPAAVLLTVLFGLMAAPVERLRFRS